MLLIGIVVALLACLPSVASASPTLHFQTHIAAIAMPGQLGPDETVGPANGGGTRQTCNHPMIGSPHADYAYDLHVHKSLARPWPDSGLTSPATTHLERGPPAQAFNDVRRPRAAEDGASIPSEITGYTNHGLEQALTRDGGVGVSESAMEDAVANPIDVVRQENGTFKFIGNDAVVVLNSDGRVVTTYATNSAGWRNVP